MELIFVYLQHHSIFYFKIKKNEMKNKVMNKK